MKIKLLITLCLVLSVHSLVAQTGREFWFVAPEVTVMHGDTPIMFRITALDQPATVTVSMPATGTVIQTLTIPSYTQRNVELNKDVVENRPSNRINSKGIQITSDQDITVYYEVANGVNPDKFTLKGTNALGHEFFVPSQDLYYNKPHNPIADEKVDIVATTDNTQITIIPTVDIVGHAANVPFTITLDKGQTFSIENRDEFRTSSLAGTHIKANKDIAVTISDDSIWEKNNLYGNPAWPYDLIGDQLIPTTVIGTEYIAVRTSKDHQTINKVFLLATHDDTYIIINNDPTLQIGPLAKGEQLHIDIADFDASNMDANAIHIKSTKPVYAYQLAGLWNKNGNEMGSAILPPINCTGSQSVTFVRSFDKQFYVQLLTQRKNIGSFTLKDQAGRELYDLSNVLYDENGNSYSSLSDIPWTIVKGTNSGGVTDETWYSAVVSMGLLVDGWKIITQGITTGIPYTITNSSGLFHMSILDENQGSVSYGYFSLFSGKVFIEGPTQECTGNVIVLSTSEPMNGYNWFSSKTGETVLSTSPTLEVTESGKYWVSAEPGFGACILNDEINVEFTSPQFDLGPDIEISPDATVTVGVENGLGDYAWSTGETSNEIDVTVHAGETKTVSLTVTDEFNCSATDSKRITAQPLPVIALDKTEVCEGGKIVNTTSLERYEWRYNGRILNSDDTQNWITPTRSGNYTITGWDAKGHLITETIHITVNNLPAFEIADQSACVGTTSTINAPLAGARYTYLWSDGSTGASLSLNTADDYSLTITDANGCKATDNFRYRHLTPRPIDLGNDREECAGISLTIDQGSAYENFTWEFQKDGAGPRVVQPTPRPEHAYEIANSTTDHSGIYYVTATEKATGCEVTDQVNVRFYNATQPTLNLAQNMCGTDPITISTSTGYTSYSWNRNGAPLSHFDNLNQIQVNSPGTYQVVSTHGGCTKTEEITVTQYDNPNVQLINDFSLCEGSTGEITVASFTQANGAFDYLEWNDSGIRSNDWQTAKLSIDAPTASMITPNPIETYTVTVYDVNGCKATDAINIGIYNKTNIGLIDPTATCTNTPVNLVNPVAMSSNYQWYKVEATGDVPGPINTDWTVSTPGTYRLRITHMDGCEASETVVVKKLPTPVVDLGLDREMCQGDEIVVTTSQTIAAYEWNNDPSLSSPTLKVKASGDYKVRVTNAHGCSAEDVVRVTVNPIPTFSLTDHSVCAGNYVTLTAPAGLSGIKWSTGATTSSINVPGGTYTLEATSNKGCVGKAKANVVWFPAPQVRIGGDEFICPGEQMILEATPGFEYYEWHTGSNARSIVAQMADTVNIVKVRDSNGCWGFAQKIVKFHPAPTFDIPNQLGCNTKTIQAPLTGAGLSYLWSDNSTGSSLDVTKNGNYSLTITNQFGCSATDLFTYNQYPSARFDLGPDKTVCSALSLSVNQGHTFKNYNWRFQQDGSGSISPLTKPDPEHTYHLNTVTPDHSGVYYASAIDQYGCTVSDFVTVTFVQVDQPVIVADGKLYDGKEVTLSTNPGYENYIWYVDGKHDPSLSGNSIKVQKAGLYKVEVSMGECMHSATYKLEITSATSVEQQDLNPIRVYPNPSSGYFVIKPGDNTSTIEKIQVYNTLGELIMTQLKPTKNEFNIGTKGLYIVVIHTNSGVYKTNVIVK